MGYIRNAKARGRGFEARWYDAAALDKDGEPKQRSKTFRTHAEARAWLRTIDATTPDERREKDEARERAATPFRDVAEEWYETTAPRKRKTRAGYRHILKLHLLPAFGSEPVGEIDAGSIDLFMARLTVAPATVRGILRVLSMVLRHAVKRRMIATNSAIDAAKPKVERRSMCFLAAAQVRDIADAITPEYRAYVYAAAYTGMRAGEMVGLRVGRIDFLRREIEVVTSVSDVSGHLHDEGSTKSGKRRTLSIPASLADMLSVQVAGKDRDALVFSQPVAGGFLRHGNFMTRHWRPTVKRLITSDDYPTWTEELAGLRFHDLRHTCAALLIASGVHAKVISEHLGHSSISITMDIYGHVMPSQREQVAAKLNEAFTSALDEEPTTGEVVALG